MKKFSEVIILGPFRREMGFSLIAMYPRGPASTLPCILHINMNTEYMQKTSHQCEYAARMGEVRVPGRLYL